MLENTLVTRCMVLGCTVLGMDIVLREPGMRGEDKGLGCTHSKMGILNQVIGKTGFSMCPAFKTIFLELPLPSAIPKFLVQCR